MGGLERYRNHFYNWYDTLTLQPLLPRYVSTVDSGNLAAHLLTLRAGLAALPDEPILGARTWEGLRDTVNIVADTLQGSAPAAFAQFKRDLESAASEKPATMPAARA